MNNIYEFPRQDLRYDEASAWIAKLDRELSDTEQQALRLWMAADPENQAALLEMAKVWDKMTVLSRLSDLFPETAAKANNKPLFRLATAASFSIVVLAGIVGVVTLKPGNTPDKNQITVTSAQASVYETAIGEQSTVNLTDGSQVVLNTNSLVEVNYTVNDRLVSLERGEIHVQVTHDAARPLSVLVGENIVQAVGTAFSLEITEDQKIELVVTEGKVRVGVRKQLQNITSAGIRIASLDSSSLTVTAGEELLLGEVDEEITEVSPEEIEAKLSWREGNLIFKGESLEVAVSEIGRYTTVEFVIVEEDLKKVRIAGLFRAGDIDGLLAALKENFDIANERTSDGKILLTSL